MFGCRHAIAKYTLITMHLTFVDILNVLLRLTIIGFGCAFIFGYVPTVDENYRYLIGGLMIVFGLYRLFMYFYRIKQLQASEESHEL